MGTRSVICNVQLRTYPKRFRCLFAVVSAVATRPLHSTPHLSASSPLLNLSGLSISRESQHLAKEYKIPRTEFSPHLELIKSSEVLPFASLSSSQDKGGKELLHRQAQRRSGPKEEYHESANAKAVSTAAAHLINELAVTRSTIQNLSREKAMVDADIKRKNRDVLYLSLFSTALVLALLFPDQRSAFNQWAFRSWMDASEVRERRDPSRFTLPRENGNGKQDILLMQRDSLSGTTHVEPISNGHFHPSPISSPSRSEKTLPPVPSEEVLFKPKRSSALSGYFWSSAS